MTLKQKTLHGLTWSFIDNFVSLFVNFIFGIILARLLTPSEFGLTGMLTIFITVSQTLIESSFGQALIRKKDCTQDDYSTVFIYNFIVSIILYVVLYFSSGSISVFLKEPQLKNLLQLLGIILVINGLTVVHRTQLQKRLDFKLQFKISFWSSILSGLFAVIAAYKGMGVWSLILKSILTYLISLVLYWLWNSWKPSFIFNVKSFKELFGFSIKILISNIIGAIYNNIYYVVIGKYFSADQLGYYSRADQFQTLPSQGLTGVIQRVSYPALSTISDNQESLKSAYQKLIKCTMLLTFTFMIGLAAISKSLILTLIGAKWFQSIEYLQMLCFIGMFYPLHALNLNMIQVKGRSELYLKLEIVKKILSIPIIILGVIFGMKTLILGLLVNTIIAYYLNSYWSGMLINYKMSEQIKDILIFFIFSLIIGIIVYSLELFLKLAPIYILTIQIIAGFFLTISIYELFRIKDYLYLKNLIISNLPKLK